MKKLHLNQRGNSVFAWNVLRYLRSKYWENVNCFAESYDEYKSKNLKEDSTDSYEKSLKDICKKNLRNINSLRSKFNLLVDQIKGIIDVLIISETKPDESFPVAQFWIPGYASHFRLDRDQDGGEITVFIREDIPGKFLCTDTKPIQDLYTELNFHKREWLYGCSCNPNKNNIMNHLDALWTNLDLYSSEYKRETKKPCMQSFLKLYGLRNLISEPTCYKTCLALIWS